MAGRKNGKKEVVQIDANWLLGESTDRPSKGNFYFAKTVVLLGTIASLVWAWPYASQLWLQWDWQSQLSRSENKSSEDVLPILLALNDLNPKLNVSVVHQLGSADTEKRLVAFQLLQQRLERWSGENRPNPTELIALTDALYAMQSQSPDSILLRGQLATRLLRLINSDIPNSSKLRLTIESMISSATNLSTTASAAQLSQPTPESVTAAAGLKARSVEVAISDQPVNQDPPSLQVPSIEPRSVSRLPVEPVNALRSPGYVSSPTVKIPSPKNSTSLPTVSSAVAQTLPIQVVDPTPLMSTIATPSDYYISTADNDQPTIRGIEKLPFEKLLPLLTSSQRKILQDVSKELMRRGLSRPQLEMAIDLAQGDADRRLTLMDQLVRIQDPEFDSIPWLVWMAENADAKVRRKAVALLGSMSNQDAVRNLRLLKLREPDSAIADQISQVLLASGSAANSQR
jgi:hypothetical protein